MAEMVNHDCELFGKYQIIHSFIHHYPVTLQHFGLCVMQHRLLPVY